MTFRLSDRCFVIAEAGTAHADSVPENRFNRAMRYVAAAADAGADAVKFQMFNRPKEDMFCWIDGDEYRSTRWDASVLSLPEWSRIKECAEGRGLMFLASVFETDTVAMLRYLKVEATKVASRAARDFPYGKSPPPYLVSNGMYAPPPREDVIPIECEARYPSTARWKDHAPGFSDHSGTPWRAIDAISCGCKLIEVHYYVDPLDAGPDYPASLTIDELRLICQARDAFASMTE